VTLVEMLVVVALTVLLMSVVAEVFVLASETLSQLRSASDINQKIRNIESVIRLDLANRTIREVQPPVERKASLDGILGTSDDYFVPVGFDPAQNMGYWMLEENSPADEQGEDNDDVLSFTVRLTASAQSNSVGFGGAFPSYLGRAVPGSEPDAALPPNGDGLAGSQEAEIIYFLRDGTLYRRVLLVGVPQPSDSGTNNPSSFATPESWYEHYDISARPAPTTTPGPPWPIPIVNKLGDLTYRSTRYIHQLPVNYNVGNPTATPPVDPGLATDMFDPANNFPFLPLEFLDTQVSPALGAGWHDNQTPADADQEVDHNQNYPIGTGLTAVPEVFNGRPTLRETSSASWDHPDNSVSTVWTDYWMPGNAKYHVALNTTARRPAEDAILTNVYSFDVKVWDPDAIPSGSMLATGAYVDLGKMWPGASGSVNTPGPTPTNGTPAGFPGNTPAPANGPLPGTWPPARRPNVLNPDHRGFAEPFGFDTSSSPPYAIPAGVAPDMPLGMFRSPISLCRTYDTWCSAYTKPIQVGVVPVAPPYMVPLRGIQIKIRFADPETRLTREITIVQELQ
jgi:type II secretory pathway pseudopilin PulG